MFPLHPVYPSIFSVTSVQSLSHVWLFATPWTAACQASLSITNSWSLLSSQRAIDFNFQLEILFTNLVKMSLWLPALSDYVKAFDCVDHNKLWKILKEMGIPDHLICLLRNCMQVRKQQLELDMEQQTGSK